MTRKAEWRKIWWAAPFRRKKDSRWESRMEIEKILKKKLDTIDEEPENTEEDDDVLEKQAEIVMSKKVKWIRLKAKINMGWVFMARVISFKESYVLFMTSFSPKV
ncbi:hypothetical protein F511_39891 [Dorcoceras hygrometricum]|uniref:Uncharacterized protein n=1 Tax=Dorcoceras hygrometricum TaxID=472368 RepID=A0A2Z7A0I6_9LAMI|nr:hypothetical protein F511_39891 [Dorcoceras hygrometricum]